MQAYFEELIAHVRLGDLLDIAVVACLLYWGLVWFRNRVSRALVVAMGSIAALYLAARWLDMYLTLWLFQAGFTAVVLALVVIFQQDIRRAFERLATSSPLRHAGRAGTLPELTGVLVEAIVRLAEHRTGALLVFEGREPLDRHVRGGVAVDGQISLPLLESIFQPDSPGHDGAVLIKGERIDSLGVHLPLSRDLHQLGERGTRHAAALGLAERCDALVVVVSEETGTISLAERGRLYPVQPRELISRFEHGPVPRSMPGTAEEEPRTFGATRHAGLKLAALLAAVLLWLLFAYQVDIVQRTFLVPIEYRNVPDGWVVEEPRPRFVELTLSGTERDIQQLDVDSLILSFDLSRVPVDTPVAMPVVDSLQLPAGLTVRQIRPERIRITLRPARG